MSTDPKTILICSYFSMYRTKLPLAERFIVTFGFQASYIYSAPIN